MKQWIAVCAAAALALCPAAQGAPDESGSRLAYWQQLRAEDPERFERLVRERKKQIKERLIQLKTEDPQSYALVRERHRQDRRSYLSRLRKEDPERFERVVEDRRNLFERKMRLAEKENPAAYERMRERWGTPGERRGPRRPISGAPGSAELPRSAGPPGRFEPERIERQADRPGQPAPRPERVEPGRWTGRPPGSLESQPNRPGDKRPSRPAPARPARRPAER